MSRTSAQQQAYYEAEEVMRQVTSIVTAIVMDLGQCLWNAMIRVWNDMDEERRSVYTTLPQDDAIVAAINDGAITVEDVFSDEVLDELGALSALAVRLYRVDVTSSSDPEGLMEWSRRMTTHIANYIQAKLQEDSLGEYTGRCLDIIMHLEKERKDGIVINNIV